jgi:hypothetical protein
MPIREADGGPAVGDDVEGARHGDDAALAEGEVARDARRRTLATFDAIDAPGRDRGDAGEGIDFGGVALDDRHLRMIE